MTIALTYCLHTRLLQLSTTTYTSIKNSSSPFTAMYQWAPTAIYINSAATSTNNPKTFTTTTIPPSPTNVLFMVHHHPSTIATALNKWQHHITDIISHHNSLKTLQISLSHTPMSMQLDMAMQTAKAQSLHAHSFLLADISLPHSHSTTQSMPSCPQQWMSIFWWPLCCIIYAC